jgi:dipeptidyl aminopeptidase/acylaminoacyl peptidase
VTSTGHIVFGTIDGRLMAARFDPRAVRLVGSPVTIAEGVAGSGIGPFYAMTADGTLVYEGAASASSARELAWVSRDGQVIPVDPGDSFLPAADASFRLSPDGGRVALSRQVDGNDDIYVKTLPDGPMSRLTFDAAEDNRPMWSPDGQSIVFRSRQEHSENPGGSDHHIWERRADGSGAAQLLFSELTSALAFWSPDRQWLIVRRGATNDPSGRDVLALRWGVDSVAVPFVARPGVGEEGPALSRDGRWLAYASDETGRFEIFVEPFPKVEGGGRWLISEAGGVQPVWAHNGHELFFVNPATRELMAAEFTTTPTAFTPTGLRTLFQIPVPLYCCPGNASFYDVAPGDERFLMARVVDEGRGLIVVQNLLTELERRIPRP